MKEGEDYIITGDPEVSGDGGSSWTVILKGEKYNNFILRYRDIELLEESSILNYTIDLIFAPEDASVDSLEDYEEYCSEIIEHILVDFEERGYNVYIDKKTGEKIEH